MVQSLIIRILARLNALGALTGSFILLLICNIGTPVFNNSTWSNYSTTTFDDGGRLNLGIWGYCYTPAGGATTCSKTSVGYNFAATGLPGYSVNQGTANVNIVNKPLSTALIFVPLATGATGLAALLTLLPIRIVTIMAIGASFLAVGAIGISFVIAILTFAQANARLGLVFNPNNAVHPQIGYATWFLLGCLVATMGGFLSLVIALSPSKKRDEPMRSYGDPIDRSEKANGIDYGHRKSMTSERPRSSRRVHNAYDEDYASQGLERRSSVGRRSTYSERAPSRRSRDIDRDGDGTGYDEDRRSRKSSSRPRRAVRDDDYGDEDYEPGY